jgi:uncharacterized membrane protein
MEVFMNYLMNIANNLMSIGVGSLADDRFTGKWQWVGNLLDAINDILPIILIVVGSAGTIYAVVIGVNMARADSTEKREEAKKRLINVLVGIAIIIGLILFLLLLVADGGILEQLLPNQFENIASGD